MRRPLPVLAIVLIASTALAGCGNEHAKPEAGARNTAGMDPKQNAATATQFFQAVASNDASTVAAAYALAAPSSPALSYLHLVSQGIDAAGAQADTLTVDNGRYKICRAGAPQTCHTYSAVVLADGKVNDFTVDGKRIRIR